MARVRVFVVLVLLGVAALAQWDVQRERPAGTQTGPAAKTDASNPRPSIPVCGRLTELAVPDSLPACTHGPDPAPPGIDFRVPRPLLDAGPGRDPDGEGPRSAESESPVPNEAAAVTSSQGIQCYGDGVSGPRVQAIYAVPSDRIDRYSQAVASIRQWAADVDAVFIRSAMQTGGTRHVRFVTDSNCALDVSRVVLSPAGDDSLSNTIRELAAQGYKRPDRKYLVWMDSNVLCGIASFFDDDRPGAENQNNGGTSVAPTVARTDSGCWGLASHGASVEAHELMHSMGAVLSAAPHATDAGHCTDESDRMCYEDGTALMRLVCSDAQEALFDCQHDDYFHTSPPPGSWLATHWNAANNVFLERETAATTTTAPAGDRGVYRALTPSRIFDTRTGTGGTAAKVGPGATALVQVAGAGGVPAAGVAAVAVNVTVTDPTAAGFVTVHPSGTPRPSASSLNFSPGQTVPNFVVVRVGNDGRIALFNSAGTSHLIVDVSGWYATGTSSEAGGAYAPLVPARVLDTRDGTGAPAARLGPGQSVDVKVAGAGGVPATGAAAVVLNVTVTDPGEDGHVTVHPAGVARPNVSNLNFTRGQTVANLTAVRLGDGGVVRFYNASGSAHVVADVAGWFSDESAAQPPGGVLAPVQPARILDSRNGTGGRNGALGPGESMSVQVAGAGGVPVQGVSAVIVNVTATAPTAAGYLTAYPSGVSRPLASNLNFAPGATVPNLVFSKLGADGRIALFNAAGSTHVIVDVMGWITG